MSVVAARGGGPGHFFLRVPGGKVFTFGPEEHFLWQCLDGRISVTELQARFAAHFGIPLPVRKLAAFIAGGLRGGLIEARDEACGDLLVDLGIGAEAVSATTTSAQRADHHDGAPHGRHPEQRRFRSHITAIGKEPWTLILGDPTRLFAFLGLVFGPLRYIKWWVFPGALLSALILIKHMPQFKTDWRAITSSIPWWPCMYSYEHFLNLVARVTEGTILQANGGTVRYYGIRFLLGVIIRGFIDEETARKLPPRVRLWSKAGVLLIRLGLFTIAIMIWITVRGAHPVAGQIGLFVGVLSFILFCINACPLILAEGYEVMATYIDQKGLAMRAFQFLGIRMSGRKAPPGMTARNQTGLALFGIGAFFATVYIFTSILQDMGSFLTQNMQGIGYLLMTIVLGAAVTYVFLILKYRRKGVVLRQAHAAEARARHAREMD